MVLAVCFPSSIMEHRTIAAQGQSAGIAGAQPLLIMTYINSGDSVRPAICATAATPMVTAVIFPLSMVGKCTQLAPLRMNPSPGVLRLTTTMLINNGAIVEVNGNCFLTDAYTMLSIRAVRQSAVWSVTYPGHTTHCSLTICSNLSSANST